MVTYNSLSQADKDVLSAWERNFRAWVGSTLAKGIVQARALDAARSASGGAQDILDSLDALEVVPTDSGIAGVQNLTKEEWATLINGFNNFLATYDTLAVRQNAAKAAGPTAGL